MAVSTEFICVSLSAVRLSGDVMYVCIYIYISLFKPMPCVLCYSANLMRPGNKPCICRFNFLSSHLNLTQLTGSSWQKTQCIFPSFSIRNIGQPLLGSYYILERDLCWPYREILSNCLKLCLPSYLGIWLRIKWQTIDNSELCVSNSTSSFNIYGLSNDFFCNLLPLQRSSIGLEIAFKHVISFKNF